MSQDILICIYVRKNIPSVFKIIGWKQLYCLSNNEEIVIRKARFGEVCSIVLKYTGSLSYISKLSWTSLIVMDLTSWFLETQSHN